VRRAVVRNGKTLLLILLLSSAHGLATTASADTCAKLCLPIVGTFQRQHQGSQDVRPLERGKPIDRELAGNQANTYSIAIRARQYLKIVVDQHGINVVVTLFSPDGDTLASVDSPNGTEGPEPVSFVTEVSGRYRLEVRSLDSTAAAGRYRVKVDELRMATGHDKAEELYRQAEALREQATVEGLRSAIVRYTASLPLYRAAGDSGSEAAALNQLGSVYDDLGEEQRALDSYIQALALFRAVGDRASEAILLNNIGDLYHNLGEIQKALDYYARALSLRRAVGDRHGEATTLHNIGRVHDDLGEEQEALDFFAQALPLLRAVEDSAALAEVLNSTAAVYRHLGENQKALDSYSRALTLRRLIGNHRGEAITLNNLGTVSIDLGDFQKALAYFDQALVLARTAGERHGEAAILHNIGGVYDNLGEKQKALDSYSQALSLSRTIGDRRRVAQNLNNIGAVYNDLGERRKALDSYAEALTLFLAVEDRDGQAKTLNGVGWVYSLLGEKLKALDSFNQALTLFRFVGDRSGEAATLYNRARLERGNGDLDQSLADIANSLTIADSLRTRIGSQELRASYFATVQDYHEFNIDLLMQLNKQNPSQGYDGRALEASERGRARSLLETLAEAHADIRQGVDSTLLARERKLEQQLNAKAQQQATLLGGTHTSEQAATIAAQLEALTTDLQQTEAAIRTTSPRYAALTQPSPLNLREVQQALDAGTVLLEYSLGRDVSYLWAVTPTTLTSYTLPPRAEIETAARRFYELLNTRNRLFVRSDQRSQEPAFERHDRGASPTTDAQQQEIRGTVSRLSQMLLGPVAAQLGQKRVVVVAADGIMQYVPFGALADPATLASNTLVIYPLIVRHEVISLPSASVLVTVRREVTDRAPAPRTLAVLADPVFSPEDERVHQRSVLTMTDSQPAQDIDTGRIGEMVRQSALEAGARRDGAHLVRLIGTRREAEGILAMVPVPQARRAFDFNASRALATSGELSQYRYVHFATHGLLNKIHPELTAIVLSLVDTNGSPQDGFLRAHEVYNLKLPADVIVLSGCETGLGAEVKGEGLIGLTRGFMYAGAPRVVVSLWSVDDDATAELMIGFYRGMLRQGKRPADALRAAQIAMWKKGRWQAPHYWAAFVLQGEWR
jgi:CHAT domain-containing protein/Tfp pilus assembly protein PilF